MYKRQGVLEQMVDELVSLPKEQRPVAAFEIARTACWLGPVSYTHLRAHETVLDLVCRLLLEKKKKVKKKNN